MDKKNLPRARSWCVLLTMLLLLIPGTMKGDERFTYWVYNGLSYTRQVLAITSGAGQYYTTQRWEYFVVTNDEVSPDRPYVEIKVSYYDNHNVDDAARDIKIHLNTGAAATPHQLYFASHGTESGPTGESMSGQDYGIVYRASSGQENAGPNGDQLTCSVYRIYPTAKAIREGLREIMVEELWDEDNNGGQVTNTDTQSKGDYKITYSTGIHTSDNCANIPTPTFDRTNWNTVTMTASLANTNSYYENYWPRWVAFDFCKDNTFANRKILNLSSSGNKTGNYTLSDNDYVSNDLTQSTTVYYKVYSFTSNANGNDIATNDANANMPVTGIDGINHLINSLIPAVKQTTSSYSYVTADEAKTASVKGCPSPVFQNATFNKFTRNVNLKWSGKNTDGSGYYTDGKWHIYLTRYTKSNGTYTQVGNRVEVDSVALGTLEYNYTISTDDYDKYMKYDIVFKRNNWTYTAASPTFTQISSIGTQSDFISTERTYSLHIEQDRSDSTQVTIKYNYEEVADNSTKVTIERKVDNGAWSSITSLNTLTANAPGVNVSGNSYTDKDATSPCSDYYYRITINTMNKNWTDSVGPIYPSNGTYLVKLSASKGTYSNLAKVTWYAKQRGVSDTRYVLLRRLLNSTNDADWKEIYSEQGTKGSYSFEDNTAQPGQYYSYKVECYGRTCESSTDVPTILTDVGFCSNTGVISGRITYGTGTAVANARVTLTKGSDSGSDIRQFSSLKVNGNGSRLKWNLSDAQLSELFKGTTPFTIQLWVNPEKNITTGVATKYSTPRVIEICDNIKLNMMRKDSLTYYFALWGTPSSSQYQFANFSDLTVPANQFTNIALTFDGSKWSMRKVENDKVYTSAVTGGSACNMSKSSIKAVTVGGTTETDANHDARYCGYIDDIRIWKKALTDDEMLKNYDHQLVGTEAGLTAYWPLDEQLDNYAFDVSSSNGVSNENHAAPELCNSSNVVPKELSLYALTDDDGNYVIRGIRYSEGGTNYNVVPSLGIHSFSPSKESRYISQSSLNFSAVSFSDVSSFPVNGIVYYANTNYPVKGVGFSVDGQVCTKDGKLITTNDNGEYTISVPIGDHFIEASMVNHNFVNSGRYPVDPAGLGEKITFTNSVSNLNFYDSTLVTVAGRICGGKIEYNKVLGFGKSTNNIGQAKVTLSPVNDKYYLNWKRTQNGTVVEENKGTEKLAASLQSSYIHNTAYRDINDSAKNIVILTDKSSGEFAALVPPLKYNASVIVVNNKNINIGDKVVDATNPAAVTTDTLDKTHSFSYVASLRPEYHSTSHFSVTDKNHTDGAYGESSYTFVAAPADTVTLNDIYSVSNGIVSYKYGGPIFVQGKRYTFALKAYEHYENNDTIPVSTFDVPLANVPVTAQNGLSSEQFVLMKDSLGHKTGDIVDMVGNTLTLDSLGTNDYMWEAGMPDITSPYNGRGFNFAYEISGSQQNWENEAQRGIILGCLPTGTNFITGGPSIVEMILRDPPGSASSATWTKGSSITNTHEISNTFNKDNEYTSVSHLGNTSQVFVGATAGVITEIGVKQDLTAGVNTTVEAGWNNSFTTTVKTETGYSTKAEPEYVGEQGDLFIGEATNITYGNANKLRFTRVSKDNYVLKVDPAFTSGLSFSTQFAYTTNYIENTLIPNLIAMRNNKLIHIDSDISLYPAPTGNTPLYVTNLKEGNEKFGENGTYRFVAPTYLDNNTFLVDSVEWFNSQIEGWKTTMKNNEMAKITAMSNRVKWLDKNYSFTTGGSISSTISNDSTSKEEIPVSFSGSIVVGYGTGITANKTGVDIDLKTTIGYHHTDTKGTENTYSQSTSFTMAATGDDDALSVDVFNAPDGMGPIFITRGGQTSCPYEPATYTRYYNPGTKLDEATMQIEDPHIYINHVKNAVATSVPNGTDASFRMVLTNTSATGENVYFPVFVPAKGNKNGAKVAIDGETIDGRSYLVNAGDSVVKTIIVSQTRQDVLNYDSIPIVIASSCQKDPTSTWNTITDTAYISVHFVPSSSPVTLTIPVTTMNTATHAMLLGSIKDYDLNYENFKALRLQYSYANSATWYTLKEYRTEAYKETGYDNIIPGEISLAEDFSNYSDGVYQLRVVSVAVVNGSDEVYRYSDVVTLTKDMASPTIIGTAQPTDGVLSAGDDIAVRFNEDIQNDKLTKSNFLVTGALNGSKIANSTGLKLGGNESTAYTDADITLSGKSFTLETWMYPESSGTFFTHGKASSKLKLALDATNHLVASLNGKDYTSAEVLPTKKWQYLAVSYDVTDTTLDVYSFNDANTLHLMNKRKVTAYNGDGAITLGGNLQGAVHELTLWDYARPLSAISSEMNVTKSPQVQGLIGYWKFDEGSGTSAADVARHRNMTLPAESWYINNVNKSVALDGTQGLTMNIASINPSDNDNYAIELWFKGDKGKQKSKTPVLFSTNIPDTTNTRNMTMAFNAEGQLLLLQGTDTMSLGRTDYLDNTWHHLAMNVLRQSTASFYIDGVQIKQTSASNVRTPQGSMLLIGFGINNAQPDCYFVGNVDELRFWNATLNANVLNANRKTMLEGTEAGLVAYYPFEKKTLNSGGQVITVTSDVDKIDSVSIMANSGNIAFSDDAPALTEVKTLKNLDFSFVSDERNVVITLNNSPAELEDCTVNFVMKNVIDNNGNECSPIRWSAYVKRNQLLWTEDGTSLQQQLGKSSTFTATINNGSGENANWSIENIPSWLTASASQGTLKPLASKEITFTVSPSVAVGKYDETIYLLGDNQIYEPFTVTMNVEGEKPDWSVNAANYETEMNIVGSLKFMDMLSENPSDMIAAFIDGKCVGVASPVYSSRYDTYFTLMTVHGNYSDVKKNVTFKAWKADTGTLYPSVSTSSPIVFMNDTVIALMTNPLVWNADDKIQQDLYLNGGWNWISFYAKPDDLTPATVFGELNGNATIVKTLDMYTSYDEQGWNGQLTSLDVTKMYKISLKNDGSMAAIGNKVISKENPVSVQNGWNWIGYNSTFTMSPDEAFAALSPVDGDIVKSQNDFAIYNTPQWDGSLKVMTPGMGYMYKSKASAARSFSYPAQSASTSSAKAQFVAAAHHHFERVSVNKYPNNMTVTGRVMNGDMPVSNVEVGVFCGDECRSSEISDSAGYVYLTISGDGKDQPLNFRSYADGEEDTLAQTITYSDDAVYGSHKNPYLIDLAATTGISNVQSGIRIYPARVSTNLFIDGYGIRSILVGDIGGRILKSVNSGLQSHNTVDVSSFAEGIYIVVVMTDDGYSETARIVKRNR